MIIVDQFRFKGELYVVVETGSVFRLKTNGSIYPRDWEYELVAAL